MGIWGEWTAVDLEVRERKFQGGKMYAVKFRKAGMNKYLIHTMVADLIKAREERDQLREEGIEAIIWDVEDGCRICIVSY